MRARWIGAASVSFQPSEFAKLALVLYLAAMLATPASGSSRSCADSSRCVVPVVLMAVLVLIEPDMGTASLLVMIAFAMLFVAGARLMHLFAILARARRRR